MNDLLSSRLYNNENFYQAFAVDVRNAKRSLIIESPFITSRRMNDILPALRKLRRNNVRVIVNTRNPEEHDYDYATQAVHAIATMQNIGVTVLYTVKHHRKLAVIDNEILWEGSLNILSQNDSCEIMRRIKSKELSYQLINFLRINSYM